MTTPAVSKRFLRALSQFEQLLQCPICDCAEEILGVSCTCPICHLPARVGNLRKNLSHDTLVACAIKIRSLTNTETSVPIHAISSTAVTSNTTPKESMPTSPTVIGKRPHAETEKHGKTRTQQKDKRRRSTECSNNNNNEDDDNNKDMKSKQTPNVTTRNKSSLSNSTTHTSNKKAKNTNTLNTITPVKQRNNTRKSLESMDNTNDNEQIMSDDTTSDSTNNGMTTEITPRVSLRGRKVDNYYAPANYSGYDDTCLNLFGTKRKAPTVSTSSTPIRSPVFDASSTDKAEMKWACSLCTYENKLKRRQCQMCLTPRGKQPAVSTPSYKNNVETKVKEEEVKEEIKEEKDGVAVTTKGKRSASISNSTHDTNSRHRKTSKIADTTPCSSDKGKRSSRRISIDQPQSSVVNVTPCILITGLKRNERDILKSAAVKRLPFKIVEEFTQDVTHVVVPSDVNGIAPRTAKYMAGLLTGRWIVQMKWITASAEAGHWLDPDDYEVTGDSAVGECHAPRESRLRENAQVFE
ncbi:hypothetical protein BDF22DRAFT_699203 [Syncephalis plumigaleata]|nr:hypothetical protein BDF22DRAFT_699203 [Syncephalis plumigaleata]